MKITIENDFGSKTTIEKEQASILLSAFEKIYTTYENTEKVVDESFVRLLKVMRGAEMNAMCNAPPSAGGE